MNTENVYYESVRDLLHRPGEMREREREFVVPEQFGEALAVVPIGENMHLDMRFESVHDGVLATVSVDTKYHAECGRCLTNFVERFEVDFTELFAYTLTEADEYGVHGDLVNLEPPLRDAVVLALPFQPVCRPDCAGLDPETGEPLQAGEQGADKPEIDPRWAALAEFQADNKRGVDENVSPIK